MPWIKEADLPDLPDIFRVLSLDTNALEVVEQMNEGLAFGNSNLTRVRKKQSPPSCRWPTIAGTGH